MAQQKWRSPSGAAEGYLVGVIALVVIAPLVAAAWLASGLDMPEAGAAAAAITYLVVVNAAVILYFHWRMAGGAPAAWLVTSLTALSFQGLSWSALIALRPEQARTHAIVLALTQAAACLGLVAAAHSRARRPQRLDPLALGLGIGLALAATSVGMVQLTQPAQLSAAGLAVLDAAMVLVNVAIATALLKLTVGLPWVRLRVGAAVILIGIGHTATFLTHHETWVSLLGILANLSGAVALFSIAFELIWISIHDNWDATALLRTQLERVESGVRTDRARLHEIRATMAGISSASRLLQEPSAVTVPQRHKIESMMGSEMDRLERLMAEQPVGHAIPVDLDSAIRPVVVRHQTRGYPIRWNPTGDIALARSDDVSTVLNVLLDNAYRHAPDAGAWIDINRTHDWVEVLVSDSGPGIDRTMRERVFEWGERGIRSTGEGIGLNSARDLCAELGGYLRLIDSPAPGTTFVLGLPTVRSGSGHARTA